MDQPQTGIPRAPHPRAITMSNKIINYANTYDFGGTEIAYSITGHDNTLYIGGYASGPSNEFYDAFLSKYSKDGEQEWVRLLGIQAHAPYISVQATRDGSAIVVASDRVSDPDWDIRIFRYNASGDLLWENVLEGNGRDLARSVIVDEDNTVYITGTTASSVLEGEAVSGNSDIFVASYDADGSKRWVKLLGGWSNDEARSLTIDSSKNIYVTGGTKSDIGTAENHGEWDALVAKLNRDGDLIWSELIGSNKEDMGEDLWVDNNGDIFLTGYTEGSLGISLEKGGRDAFVARLSHEGEITW